MAKKATLGEARVVEPNAALLAEIHRTVGHVEALAAIVAEIPRDELVRGETKVVEVEGDEFGSRTVTVEAAPNVWLRLYREERRHLLDACRAASGCGVVMEAPDGEDDAVSDLQRRAALRIAR